MKRDKPQPLLARPLFWAALVLPFGMDFFVGGTLLTSLFGAALWGLLISLSAWKPLIRDFQLQKIFNRAEKVLWSLWIMAWAYLFFFQGQDITWLHPLSRTSLLRIHAFLLAGASGLVLLFGLSSVAGILQQRRMQSPSWVRRKQKPWSLPSLESLSKISSMASFWAFTAWGVGLALATLTLMISVGSDPSFQMWNLLLDSQILLSIGLWVLLLFAFLAQGRFALSSQKKSYLLTSVASLFWIGLIVHAVSKSSDFHEPLRWFLK